MALKDPPPRVESLVRGDREEIVVAIILSTLLDINSNVLRKKTTKASN
jgi:hypothetical protein